MPAPLLRGPARVQEGRLAARWRGETGPGDPITLKTTEEQTEVPFAPQKPESSGEDLIPTPQCGNSEQVQRLVH